MQAFLNRLVDVIRLSPTTTTLSPEIILNLTIPVVGARSRLLLMLRCVNTQPQQFDFYVNWLVRLRADIRPRASELNTATPVVAAAAAAATPVAPLNGHRRGTNMHILRLNQFALHLYRQTEMMWPIAVVRDEEPYPFYEVDFYHVAVAWLSVFATLLNRVSHEFGIFESAEEVSPLGARFGFEVATVTRSVEPRVGSDAFCNEFWNSGIFVYVVTYAVRKAAFTRALSSKLPVECSIDMRQAYLLPHTQTPYQVLEHPLRRFGATTRGHLLGSPQLLAVDVTRLWDWKEEDEAAVFVAHWRQWPRRLVSDENADPMEASSNENSAPAPI